jgi:hypothetical protein
VVTAKSATTIHKREVRCEAKEDQRVSYSHLRVYQMALVDRNGKRSRCCPPTSRGMPGAGALYRLSGRGQSQSDGMKEGVRPSKDHGTIEV